MTKVEQAVRVYNMRLGDDGTRWMREVGEQETTGIPAIVDAILHGSIHAFHLDPIGRGKCTMFYRPDGVKTMVQGHIPPEKVDDNFVIEVLKEPPENTLIAFPVTCY